MVETALLNLALLLVLTTALVMVLRMFKQPPILSYIIAGILAGPAVLGWTAHTEFLEIFSSLGIAFLLFVVGISLDFRELKRVGVAAGIAGIAQVLITGVISYLISLALGFGIIESVYLSIALTFSSTIIIVKLLADKKDIDSLYGKLSLGILLVQDFVAVLALVFINGVAIGHDSVGHALLVTAGWAIAVSLIAFGVHVYLLPKLIRAAGKSQEVLFLFSITWCFALAVLFEVIGLGLEVGALVAGLMLASTQFSYEIGSKVRPLRDFFIIIFFILLGSQLTLVAITGMLIPAIILSALIIIGNPLIVMGILGLLGFSKRVAFFAGSTIAQISEFSLIIITLGVAAGHVGDDAAALITLVALITISTSTYGITHLNRIYRKIGKNIPYYRRGVYKHEKKQHNDLVYDVIVFGRNRAGSQIVDHFAKKNDTFLVIDFDPMVVERMQRAGHDAIFGDANDAELYEELRIDKAHLVISTITDRSASSLVLSKVKKENASCTVILTATTPAHALELYEEGADYVIIPHILGGDHAAVMVDMYSKNLDQFIKQKDKHVAKLKKHH